MMGGSRELRFDAVLITAPGKVCYHYENFNFQKQKTASYAELDEIELLDPGCGSFLGEGRECAD